MIIVAKTKVLISCAITSRKICVFVMASGFLVMLLKFQQVFFTKTNLPDNIQRFFQL